MPDPEQVQDEGFTCDIAPAEGMSLGELVFVEYASDLRPNLLLRE